MKSDKYSRNIENLGKALAQFSKALAEPESAIVRDASIQRFEFTYELLWKTLKSFLEDFHGVRAVTPRQVFKETFAIDIIDNEDIFLEMLESRNALAHTYNEDQARDIYEKCPQYLTAMEQTFDLLSKN